MLTTCPACLTLYRISEEQLARRQGLVRCRHCQVVFNARDMLKDEPEDVWLPEAEGFLADSVGDEAVAAEMDAGAQALVAAPAMTFQAVIEYARPVAASSDAHTSLPLEVPGNPEGPPRGHPVVHGLLLILFAAGLLLQWGFTEKTVLQRYAPAFYAQAQALCAPLGCLTAPAQVAEAIEITASALDRLPGSFVNLHFTLTTRGPLSQAWPVVLLSLEDAQGGLVARRMLQPVDYLPEDATLALLPKQTLEATVRLKLDEATLPAPAVGYALAIVYP